MIRIAECKSRFGAITIFRTLRTGSFIYSQGGFFQSEADCNGVSLATYIHAIYGLLHQANSKNILMIGCGGGTLATMLSKKGCNVTVVDVNPLAFFLARKYFDLPDTVTCRIADGCEFLHTSDRTYDAIVLDAFAGNRIPAHVRSSAFFQRARTRLNRQGCIFVNVHAKHALDSAPDRMSSTMAEVLPNVRLLDVQSSTNRNAIVMAGAVLALNRPEIHVHPQTSAEEIDAELQAMHFRSWCTQS